MTRILVTGCRRWACHDLADAVVSRLLIKYGPRFVLVHGDCPTGVDAAFEGAAKAHDLPTERHPADWEKHGRRAGPLRNQAMVAAGATLCLAVHRYLMGSKGTLGCVKLALAAGIPTWLISDETGALRRITEGDLR